MAVRGERSHNRTMGRSLCADRVSSGRLKLRMEDVSPSPRNGGADGTRRTPRDDSPSLSRTVQIMERDGAYERTGRHASAPAHPATQ